MKLEGLHICSIIFTPTCLAHLGWGICHNYLIYPIQTLPWLIAEEEAITQSGGSLLKGRLPCLCDLFAMVRNPWLGVGYARDPVAITRDMQNG